MRHNWIRILFFILVLTTPALEARIGIMCALPAECGNLPKHMDAYTVETHGGRNFYHGTLHGIDTVFVAAGIGKVAAATAATHLIAHDNVDAIIFIGVAGALDPALNIGDVVIATSLIQHDMDARPFCSRHEIPLLHTTAIPCDPELISLSTHAVHAFNSCIKCAPGLIITGDQVISQDAHKADLKHRLPDALCVEMEGGSVAQVCYEYETPFVVIRTISDEANHQDSASIDIITFINDVAGGYARGILQHLLTALTKA